MDFSLKTQTAYPPFRKAPTNLEEDIYEIWIDDGLPSNHILLKINWTNITNKWMELNKNIQYINPLIDYFKTLDKSKVYIIVSQHDDLFPMELINYLPPKTILFNAGGNVRNKNIIPVPLIYNAKEDYNLLHLVKKNGKICC